jgi:membrane-bound metal-dependent hydrolase YbcI (DUF457 family)
MPPAAWWLALGFATHLALDALTPGGIRPLWPLGWTVRGPVRTGSFNDIAIGATGLAVAVWMLWPRA